MEERLNSHYESLTRVIGFVRAADTKAAPVLGLQIALVGTLAARSDRLQTILVKEPCDVENIILIAVIVLYGLLLVAVVAFAALAGCGRKVRRSAAVYGASTVSAVFGM